MLGTSSLPAGHEVYGKRAEKLVPSWEQLVLCMTKNKASEVSNIF